MSKRLTTPEFITRARAKHGDTYDYSLVEYTKRHIQVEIRCPKHGSFLQTPSTHLNGGGCGQCSGSRNVRLTTEYFIARSQEVHGAWYDYSLAKYVNNYTKIEIRCPEHGSFLQTPGSHMLGRKCGKCSEKPRLLTTEEFIERSEKIHGTQYDYSRVKYVDITTCVELICSEHGSFQQTPNAHMQGRGCADCATGGFNPSKQAWVYIYRTDGGRFLKIGITGQPEQRNAKLKRETPFRIERIRLYECSGETAREMERTLLRMGESAGKKGFDGATEWVKGSEDLIKAADKMFSQ